MTPSLYARHGDLVLYKDVEIPKNAKPAETNIVQRGSTDTADHVVTGGQVLREGENLFIKAGTKCVMTHAARHTTGDLPEGNYRVVRLVVATDQGVAPVID